MHCALWIGFKDGWVLMEGCSYCTLCLNGCNFWWKGVFNSINDVIMEFWSENDIMLIFVVQYAYFVVIIKIECIK